MKVANLDWTMLCAKETGDILAWMKLTGCDVTLSESSNGWTCTASIKWVSAASFSSRTQFMTRATDIHCRTAVLRCCSVVYAGFNAKVWGFAPEPKTDKGW